MHATCPGVSQRPLLHHVASVWCVPLLQGTHTGAQSSPVAHCAPGVPDFHGALPTTDSHVVSTFSLMLVTEFGAVADTGVASQLAAGGSGTPELEPLQPPTNDSDATPQRTKLQAATRNGSLNDGTLVLYGRCARVATGLGPTELESDVQAGLFRDDDSHESVVKTLAFLGLPPVQEQEGGAGR